jgi:hypothetical protein
LAGSRSDICRSMSGGALLYRADCLVVGYIGILRLDQPNDCSARFAGLLDWCARRPQNRCGVVLDGNDHISSHARPYYRWTGCYLDAKISQPTSDGNRTYQTTVKPFFLSRTHCHPKENFGLGHMLGPFSCRACCWFDLRPVADWCLCGANLTVGQTCRLFASPAT